MGSYTGKLFSHDNEHETKINNKTRTKQTTAYGGAEKMRLCTPPITKRKLATDPRSATVGIIRTPIEVARTPPDLTRCVASALPKYLQGKRYLETDFDGVSTFTTQEKTIPDPRSPNVSQRRTPIVVKSMGDYSSTVVAVNHVPDIRTRVARDRATVTTLDPRSPATDFDRTPIPKPRSTERATTSSEENVDSTIDGNVGKVKLSYCETTTDYRIPEIQTISEIALGTNESPSLENSSLDPEENWKNSILSRNSEEVSDDSENEEQITVIRNTKVLSSHSDALSTWTEDKKSFGTDRDVAEKIERVDGIDESMGKTLDNIGAIINTVIENTIDEQKTVTNNDKIKVWRDSISPNINEENKNCARTITEEILIEFDDDTITKNSKIVAKLGDKIEDDKSQNETKKKKPQQQQLKEGKNPTDVTLNRTPLGNRSNNHKQRPLVSAKSPQQLLRNKGLSVRTIQQENTPPTDRFISKTKPHGIQWDLDTTIII